MSLIRKHGAVLQAWACLDLVFLKFLTSGDFGPVHCEVKIGTPLTPVVRNVYTRSLYVFFVSNYPARDRRMDKTLMRPI